MSSATTPSVTLSDVGFTWPDGTPALAGVSGTFGAGRATTSTGQVGPGWPRWCVTGEEPCWW